MAVALLDRGADIDHSTSPRHGCFGFTPLMYAAMGNHAGLVRLLHKLGADGTSTTTRAALEIDAGSTALDIARLRTAHYPIFAETFAALCKRCCSTCGMTSPGLSVRTRLKQCSGGPAGGPSAQYCSEQCQREDWVSRHRAECQRRGAEGA